MHYANLDLLLPSGQTKEVLREREVLSTDSLTRQVLRCIRYALLAGQAHLLAVEHVRCDIGVLCCRTGRLLETRFGEGVLAQRLGARRLQRALPLRLELAGSGRIGVATLCESDVNGLRQSMAQTNRDFLCSSNCIDVYL